MVGGTVNPHGAEVLVDDGTMSRKGRRMLDAMLEANHLAVASSKYSGHHRLLMMYGAGLEPRRLALEAHRKAGGRVAVWDLGYWDRDDSMRLSVDSLHPTAEQLSFSPATGSRREHVLREEADPLGPILLIGLGRKSAKLYGLEPMEWERKALEKILASTWHRRKVIWRPKGKRIVDLPGTVMRHGMPIEEVLKGCSLVVCRHSNVAVDACIAGVPVECEDGAAYSLYRDGSAPTAERRLEFLRRLGWWNWRPSEAREAWDWIARVIG